ncbi:WD repeat, SAM and U-box domain-containing protein 1-like isoform X2 [Salvelinus sp. IW2-2015]|uniref:WD repeat, SAM and U-box domain-containing protein 1-like isoform X2 n=1 Tax=Salvelinus sp. IW2-2015 TaxID=2691554 RepID=UPI0038D4B133
MANLYLVTFSLKHCLVRTELLFYFHAESCRVTPDFWSVIGQRRAWLCEEGLEMLVENFKANNIDGAELVSLTKETLASKLNIESVGLRSMVLRKVGELKAGGVCTGVPDEFLCPITRELMKDLVIAADGYSWITTKNRSSPMTNLPLRTTLLSPNRTLKMAIGRWRTGQ